MAEIPGTSDVRLPDEVKRKIELGRELQRTLMAEAEGQDPAQNQEDPPAVVINDPSPDDREPPPQQDPTNDDDGTGEDDELQRLRHAFRSLQGRYANETERSKKVVDELSARLSDQQRQMLELTARVVVQPPSEKNILTPPREEATLTDEEVREYTPQFFDMMRRFLRQEVGGAVDSRVAAITPRVEQLAERIDSHDTAAERARWARFDSWMDGNVSGWREQDEDPDFSGWLKQKDQFSGLVRMKILHDALETEDYSRVKLIYEGYATERQAISPPRRASTAAADAAANGRDKLGRMVAPNGGRSSRPPPTNLNNPEAVPLTSAEIAAYYTRKIRYPKSLSAAEIDLMEKRIAVTGRVAAEGGMIRHH